MMGFGQGGDLFRMRQPTRHAHVRAHVLGRPTRKQHLKLVDGVQSLPRGDGDVNVLGQQSHRVKVVGQDRILVEEGMVLLDAPREDNGL